MRLRNLLVTCLILACTPAGAQTSFQYLRTVEDVDREGWYSITLPPDIFRDLNRELTDVRLYALDDGDTTETPYLLKILSDRHIENEMVLPLLNRSSRDGRLYLTFELPAGRQVNALRLNFEEGNYFGRVTIEGSDDRFTWFEIIKDERIVSVERDGTDYALSMVRFPASRYRYLRLNVQADAKLTFRDATFAYDSIRPGSYRDVPLRWKGTSAKSDRTTTIDVTLNEYGPVSTVSVKVDNDADYFRAFALEYVSDSTRTQKGWIRQYRTAVTGHLTSFEENRFSFPVVFARHLRFVIQDRDNRPLTIREVSASGPEVVLISHLKPGRNMLLYGRGAMRSPVYDLTHFADSIPESMADARLGAPESIAAAGTKSQPIFENPIWLWAIMGIMIVGLGYFTIKMMKSK